MAYAELPLKWAAVAAFFLLGLGVLAHALMPRFEYQVAPDGYTLVIYDKWTGKFQRAVYSPDGDLKLQRVITPF